MNYYAVASAASSIFFVGIMYYTLKKIKKDLDSVWNYLIFTQNTTINFREKLEIELQDVREALGGKIEKNLLEAIKKRKEAEEEKIRIREEQREYEMKRLHKAAEWI